VIVGCGRLLLTRSNKKAGSKWKSVDPFILIVCATIVKDKKVLLVRHSDPGKPDYGDWILPAGRLEPGEDLEEGLHREIREETSLEVKIVRRLVKHMDPYTGDRLSNFLCIPLTSRIDMSSELMEARWQDPHEIQGLENIHLGLKRFLVDGLSGDAFRQD